MDDSLFYNNSSLLVYDTSSVDTSIQHNAIVTTPASNFIGSNNIEVLPLLHNANVNIEYITFAVFILLGLVSFLWFTVPERLTGLFSLKSPNSISMVRDSVSRVPGLVITMFFWLNFIIALSIFIFILVDKYFSAYLIPISDCQLFRWIIVMISGSLAYRFLIIYGTAILFKSQKLMKQQVLYERNTQIVTGVFLLPMLLLMSYSFNTILLYGIVAILLLIQLLRLVQIVIIGKSSTVFSAFHIILYLCTLEIIPILVLTRLISNDFFI